MKYKVGDKVRIKSKTWIENQINESMYGCFFEILCDYSEMIATITKVHDQLYEIDIDDGWFLWGISMFDETYKDNKMESKKVKITLPKKCEVEKVETSVEDGYLVVEYTPKEKFSPKDGDIIVTEGLICISDGTLLDIGCGVYCARLRKGGISCYSDSRPFSEGYKENIRLATNIEKKLLFSEMERCCLKWNPEQKKLEKIRWRAERFHSYYFMTSFGDVVGENDDFSKIDSNRFEIGNYFQTKEEAQKYADKIKELLKNRP